MVYRELDSNLWKQGQVEINVLNGLPLDNNRVPPRTPSPSQTFGTKLIYSGQHRRPSSMHAIWWVAGQLLILACDSRWTSRTAAAMCSTPPMDCIKWELFVTCLRKAPSCLFLTICLSACRSHARVRRRSGVECRRVLVDTLFVADASSPPGMSGR